MRLLVIGGTRFVGRHFVEAALGAGHDVTVFHRGTTGADLFPAATHLTGDRNRDLSALAAGEWDATADMCAYFPRQVRLLAQALDGRGGRHLQVSSVSAYAPAAGPGITEDAPLATLEDESVEEVTEETYGGLKAVCERVAAELFGPDITVVRPTYVVGPWDTSGRFTSWARRLARGGEVLAPGPQEQAVQVVDGRDLGAFMLALVEGGVGGAFHAATPPPPFTMGDLLEALASAVAPAGTRVTWVPAEVLAEHGVTEEHLPLWNGGAQDWMGNVDPKAAYAAGLAPRPFAETARDTVAHAGTPEVEGVGLSPEREAEILATWRGRGT